jgi:hypothetical protein
MSDETKSTVVEDFLDEDVEIPAQRYVLLSFLSPEKVLEKKDHFFFKKFLEGYEVDWKVKNLEKFMVETVKHINDELDDRARELEKNDQVEQAAICRKNRLNVDDVMGNYNQFVQKNRADITKTKIAEAYDDFMYANKGKLESDFYAINDFQTSMRGLKIRGVYGNTKEAELKAKKLQNKDKYHNIFIGEVGKWLPWDPQPHEVNDQEYAQDQLNTLMQKYKENEDNREKFFEERAKNTKQVFGGASQGGSSDSFGSMFQGQGDLALQRKMEKPNVTIEKVSEEETKSNDLIQKIHQEMNTPSETPQNTIVEPNA